MANQPKKYKKFVATAATATLVASAIVPVASAAEFKDVAGNTHAEAINALADQGIINGYGDGTFKPNQTINRGQVVKLLGRWLEAQGQEVPADWKTEQRFNDLPVTAEEELVKYAALAKDAGVFNGSNGNLNYTQSMQRQQMAVVLVRAINEIEGVDLIAAYKEAGFESEIADLDKAFSAEQREAIVALEYAEITQVSNFNPANSVTRGQFASFLYRTINMDVVATDASVKAINNTTVEVTFAEEVSDVKALDFAIEGLEITNAAVKQTNKKVVVLTTSAQTADTEYTVTLGEEKIGSFKGITAVIPTKVEMVEQSVQGKLGQQVTVKAQVTVAEGASKAGIPVTLFVPGSADGIKAPVTVEALTDENGVATHTYTRYAATTDAVTVYATGDRSKFSTGYVFWGVDTILAIEEVTEGSTINNGSNKTYKVTLKNATTGLVEANKTLNVSVKENINVTADKLQNVSVNGEAVAQLSNGTKTEAAQITTDSKGQATFTVSGTNTSEVTPIVYAGEAIYATGSTSTVTGYSEKYEASSLQATASKVKFAAVQADHKIEITRDGGEVAATGDTRGGRKYNIVVKDKDGKVAPNEIVNVAFNEDLDRAIATNTEAKFIKVDADDNQTFYTTAKDSEDGNTESQITVKTNSKGEASFFIGSDKVNDYATPVAWIDVNTSDAKDGQLDESEPKTLAQISYFQAEYLDGSKLASWKNGSKTTKFKDNEVAIFKAALTNQSGKELNATNYVEKVTYTVTNTGSSDIEVKSGEDGNWKTVSPNRNYTTTYAEANKRGTDLEVRSVGGKTTSVKVLATGVAKYGEGSSIKDYAFTAKEATATFTKSSEVGNTFTGVVKSFNTDKKELVLNDKDAVKYAGESGKTYVYKGLGGSTISDADAFIDIIKDAEVTVTRTVDGDTVTFTIVNINNNGTKPTDTAGAEQVKAGKALTDAIKVETDAKLKAEDYTKASFDAYTAALDAAKAVDVKTASTKDINKAIDALANAKKELKPSETAAADKEKAKVALADAIKAVKEEEYKSPAAVKAFVKAATEVLENSASTKADYEKAKADLAANLATLDKVVITEAVAPKASITSTDNTTVKITFDANVTVPAGSITIGTETGTVAAVDNNKELVITFTKAVVADGTATITVKTPASATVKAGEFDYTVKFDQTTGDWTVTSK